MCCDTIKMIPAITIILSASLCLFVGSEADCDLVMASLVGAPALR
jgi:hypothetical protein